MQEIIQLNEVIYDRRARGIWCTIPYPGHKRGCPNFPKCIKARKDFNEYQGYDWYAIIEEFNLGQHMKKMRDNHDHWSERQCRNVLYWQGGVRSRLRKKAEAFASNGDVILDIPEANGVYVFETMKRHGIILEKHKPLLIKKVMLVGKPSSEFNKKGEIND